MKLFKLSMATYSKCPNCGSGNITHYADGGICRDCGEEFSTKW